ncbi:MAG: hypothetical protein M3N24_11335 [Actinomycetota bacterium]|nr:hypothetical protein [Actinomycetota bacterium]
MIANPRFEKKSASSLLTTRKVAVVLIVALTGALVVFPGSIASAQTRETGCGSEVPVPYGDKCTFVASGSRVTVEGEAAVPHVGITYSIPPFPAVRHTSVTVYVMDPDGRIIVECHDSSSVGPVVKCEATSVTTVQPGLVLTCHGYVTSVGKFRCGNIGGTSGDPGENPVPDDPPTNPPVALDCNPDQASGRAGAAQSISCTVSQGDDPMAGANVDFRVVAGPNQGYLGEKTTDANGRVTASYVGLKVNGNNGTDVIDAFLDANDNDLDDADAPELVDDDGDGTVEAEDQIESGEVSDYVDRAWTGCPGFASDPRNQFAGTSRSDKLTGTNENDILCGLGGRDTLNGLGGDDHLLGGSGNDTLRGGNGDDLLVGGSGRDRCAGGPGRNRIQSCP